jgi:hypothetical protein
MEEVGEWVEGLGGGGGRVCDPDDELALCQSPRI